MANITTQVSADNREVTIRPRGNFDQNMASDFTQAYKQLDGKIAKYIVDFSETIMITSEGIGLLLLLREHVDKKKESVRIINCDARVLEAIQRLNLQDLFTFEEK